MHVLHVNSHLEWSGGIEVYLLSLMPRLERLGHRQTIVYAEGNAELHGASRCLPDLNDSSGAAVARGEAAMAEVLQQEQPDLVHVHNIYNVGVIKACLEYGPTVITGHDYRYLCPASTFYYRRTEEICTRTCGPACFAVTLNKRCLSLRPRCAVRYYRRVQWMRGNLARLQCVVAPSDYAAERFVRSGMPAAKVVTIPYFCPLDALPEPRPRPEQPTVLFMGRTGQNKGIKYLIQAVGRVSNSVKTILVGNWDASSKQRVLELVQDANLGDRLEFRPWVSREAVRAVLCEATVLAFPSVWAETLGIVGLEAMSCGVPVVASNVGGVSQWLQDGINGYLVEPKDPKALGDALERILDDPGLGDRLGQAGLELCRERFSPESHIQALLGCYEQMRNDE